MFTPQFIFRPELGTYKYMFTQAGFGKFLQRPDSLHSSTLVAHSSAVWAVTPCASKFSDEDISFWIISARISYPRRHPAVYDLPGCAYRDDARPCLRYTTFNLPFAL